MPIVNGNLDENFGQHQFGKLNSNVKVDDDTGSKLVASSCLSAAWHLELIGVVSA